MYSGHIVACIYRGHNSYVCTVVVGSHVCTVNICGMFVL